MKKCDRNTPRTYKNTTTIRVPNWVWLVLDEATEKTSLSKMELLFRYACVLEGCLDVLTSDFVIAIEPYGKNL